MSMYRQILIGGEAGQGIAKAAEILGKAFVREGFYVFNYRDYPSLIRGGHNFNVLAISDEPIMSHEFEGHDIVIALNDDTVVKHAAEMKENAVKGAKGPPHHGEYHTHRCSVEAFRYAPRSVGEDNPRGA